MEEMLRVKKILNNNVVIVEDDLQAERVVIGKGIGFGKKSGEAIDASQIDKLFVLKSEKDQEQYKFLVHTVDDDLLEVISESISHIKTRVHAPLDEHIHVALTDHIAFAVKRLEQGLDIRNPFLIETQTMYPKEYTIAEEVVEHINKRLDIALPEGEIGFVALHIHSAITNKSIQDINKHSQLVNQLMEMIEKGLNIPLNPKDINYLRLVGHLRHAIERIEQEEMVEKQERLAKVLKDEYPLCYNLAWKLIKIMQNNLKKSVPDAEAVYLTMHLQRLSRN